MRTLTQVRASRKAGPAGAASGQATYRWLSREGSTTMAISATGFAERRAAASGRRSVVWTAIAIGWAVILVVFASVVPVVTRDNGMGGPHPRHSLVSSYGPGFLILTAIPLVVALVVALLLYLGRDRGDWTAVLAWILTVALLTTTVVDFVVFLIGFFALPVGGLLIMALIEAGARAKARGGSAVTVTTSGATAEL
jgi:hypothetical protein